MSGRHDPTVVRSVAVTAEDVVVALEAVERRGRRAVLRVTPPFSARMRARLHVRRGRDAESAVHLPPHRLVADPPDYPGADGDVEAWRARVRGRIVDRVRFDTPPHEVTVTVLG